MGKVIFKVTVTRQERRIEKVNRQRKEHNLQKIHGDRVTVPPTLSD